MSMWTKYVALLFILLSSGVSADTAYQQLGKSADELSTRPEWNLTILPDGQHLPNGHGLAEQGKALFALHCAGCHGPEGIGGSAEPLVGEIGSLASDYPEKTVNSYWPYATTLYDYIRRAMPIHAPFSLTSDEIYALCAYIFQQDDIFLNHVELNDEHLPEVTMPNRHGFISVYPE